MKNKIWKTVKDFSLLLVLGSLLAIFMANFTQSSYNKILHIPGFHFLVNEVLMTLFFAVAGKEVIEAIMLKNGSLRGKQSISTIMVTMGGVVGPIVVYLIASYLLGSYKELLNGWAIPTATDIAFAYLVSVLIFGKGHPAISFLLALAILDDAIGLVILAIFYPSGELNLIWLAGVIILMGISYSFRKNSYIRDLDIWPYVFSMVGSWFCFYNAGIHPVLSAIPILFVMPHAESDLGVFAEKEKANKDLLNIFEHKLENIIPVVLGLFGFVNAGVVFASINDATWAVLIGLLVGKPLGIIAFGLIASKILGLPKGINLKTLIVLGFVAAIGFTVSLFVSIQAFPEGIIQEGAKMGALMSFGAVVLAYIMARVLKIKKID